MSDFLGEIIGEVIIGVFEFIFVRIFKYAGAGIRWAFRLGKMPYSQILKENGNGRLAGLILAGIAIIALVYFFKSDSPTEVGIPIKSPGSQ